MNPFSPWDANRASFGDDDGSGSGRAGWFLAQSAFGVLPMQCTPGSLPLSLISKPNITFRFMATGNQARISVVGPNFRPCFRVTTNSEQTYIMTPSGYIATIHWKENVMDPIVERGGQKIRASEFMREGRDQCGRRVREMTINNRQYMWTFDGKGFYVHPMKEPEHVLGYVYNNHGVELKVVDEGMSVDFINHMIIAVIVLQGRLFIGIL